MNRSRRLEISLLFMRLCIFLVMLMWTIDKFVNPEHGVQVYEHFYFIGGVANQVMTAIGVLELLVLLVFVAGAFKTLSYGAVLAFHAVSTVSSFEKYLTPFEGSSLLFFAAWPMLAACLALFLLRNDDRLASLGK